MSEIRPFLSDTYAFFMISNDTDISFCDFYKPSDGYIFSNIEYIIGTVFLSDRVDSPLD
jgi:hypothetical protein